MAISYKMDETYTGKRTTSMPDPDNEGKTIDTEEDVRDVIVTFTKGDQTHTRNVNVCFDSDGDYDEDATKARIEEVMMGVEHKMALGVIS